MNPGIILVCDPHSRRAEAAAAGMLDAMAAPRGDDVVTARGRHWAAVAIPPAVSVPTCGADIHTDGRDILIWAGEAFLPSTWKLKPGPRNPARGISKVVLDQLQTAGIEAIGEIDGAFCGAWYEASSRRWAVFTDRFGLLPVFWSAFADRLVISPKAQLTWHAGGGTLEINGPGVVNLLRTENMVDEHTLIEGVHWLRGGHAVLWGEEGCGSYSYWDLPRREATIRSEDEALDSYVEVLDQTVRRHVAGDRPLLLGISGGIDSRVLLAMCIQLGKLPDCFTAGWPSNDDVRFGRQLAKVAGARWEWAPLEADDLACRLTEAIVETDGLHSAGHLAPATAMRAYLSQHPGAVLLEGYMQGVISGAYVPADEEVAWDDPAHRQAWAHRRLHAGGEVELINGLLHPDLATDSNRLWRFQLNDRFHRAPNEDPLQRAEHTLISGRTGHIDVLGTNLLRRDVLVRTPACDRLMIDWFSRTLPRLRRGKRLCLELLRRRFPQLARVQRTASDGMPVAADAWLREYLWQREKLHRWWSGLRNSIVHRYGTGGQAIRAWTFQTWRESGQLDVLLEPGARVLEWVQRDALLDLWDRALSDPLQGGPLMSLATAEIMIRRLQDSGREPRRETPARPGFPAMAVGCWTEGVETAEAAWAT